LNTLFLIRDILGNIALALLALVIVYTICQTIKALILGYDLYKWRLIGADKQKMKEMGRYKVATGKIYIFYKCFKDCFEYNASITYSKGNKIWSGYGTGL
jgi:hypothetical protein